MKWLLNLLRKLIDLFPSKWAYKDEEIDQKAREISAGIRAKADR